MDPAKAEHPTRLLLTTYGDKLRELELDTGRLTRLEGTMADPKSQRLDGMPHGGGSSCDHIAALVSKKDELEEKITRQAEEVSQLGNEIEAMISIMEKANERAVLRLRYLDRAAWPDVFFILYGSNGDYEERYDAYTRRAFRIHGNALVSLAKVYDEMRGGSEA